MDIQTFKKLVNLPIKWQSIDDPKILYEGALTGDIAFKIKYKSAKMVYLLVPDNPKAELHFPHEDDAQDHAIIYTIDNWISIIDHHLGERQKALEQKKGQMDMFGPSYALSVEEYEALAQLSTRQLEEAYILIKKGLV